MKVAVEVADAFDLMPKDGQGLASPFVEVDFDEQRHRTRTKPKDLNPAWNETFLFDVSDPGRLPNQTITVSVYHDRNSGGGGQHRNFLGRVRISGVSIAPSPAEAPIQRCPLDKRGLFSRVRGDIALRVYSLPDSAATDPLPASTPDPTAIFPEAHSTAGDGEKLAHKKNRQSEKDKEPRVFYSVGAAPGMKPPPGTFMAEQKQTRVEPPAATAVQFPANIPRQPDEHTLVETRPRIPGRLGYRGGNKVSGTYDLVEQMHYLYVSVVKARDLPTMDLTGSLDPYVEVKVGNYKGVTKVLQKNQNPVWNQVFAFSKDRLQANLLEVVLKDRDLIKDDFVGRVVFDVSEVPLRVPPDSPLAPQWYRLGDERGEKTGNRGDIMLAVWMGTQADEAFPHAWHSDAHSVGLVDGIAHTRSKVYFSPKLCYLRVHVIEAKDLIPSDRSRTPVAGVRVQLSQQLRRTVPTAAAHSLNPSWNEELMFVAADPFDEPLIITVEDHGEAVGRVVLPLSAVPQRTDNSKPVEPRWFNLTKPEESVNGEKKKEPKFSTKIHLRVYLDTSYHVLDESTHYSSDFRPWSKHLHKAPIGILELGILDARKLMPMKAKDGRITDAYCVAKYGPKWARTRTLLNTLAPSWHEQYTWEVFDPCTILTVAVFDNAHLTGNKDDHRDQRIGKIRIRLSTLEANRVYTHYHPLLILQTPGLKNTGELHLAVRFTSTASMNMVALYGRPLLPKMHYIQPIPVRQVDYLRFQAMQIVATRLARAEPPLRREVVEYMLDVDSHMWSLRRSKANFNRITSLLSSIARIGQWFDRVRNWHNPVTTILVHVLFLILVCYPELILPTIFLCLFMIGMRNYRYRPRHPPHMDTKLSLPPWTIPDELDEEFDTFPTLRPPDIVRVRYDRLRIVAGRVQTVMGDLASQGERAMTLLSWRDPRATAIFISFSLLCAVFLYVTPFKVVAVLVGLYLLRHPKFRSKLPSTPFNFYRRLPAKSDMLL